jgi:hypothetical protein
MQPVLEKHISPDLETIYTDEHTIALRRNSAGKHINHSRTPMALGRFLPTRLKTRSLCLSSVCTKPFTRFSLSTWAATAMSSRIDSIGGMRKRECRWDAEKYRKRDSVAVHKAHGFKV